MIRNSSSDDLMDCTIFNTFKSSLHWCCFIALLKVVEKAMNYFLFTSEAWRTISVAVERNISSYKWNNGDLDFFFFFNLWKGWLKLLKVVLLLLLMYIFVQVPQCCIWNELLHRGCLIEIIDKYDKCAFVEGLQKQTPEPPKQPCKCSFNGLATLLCQVQGKHFDAIRSEKKEGSLISVSAVYHLSSLTFRSWILLWLGKQVWQL